MGLLANKKTVKGKKIKILISTEGNWLSHVSRSLVIAERLRQSGHEIEFALSGRFVPEVRREGFNIWPVYTKDPETGLSGARKKGSSYTFEIVDRYVDSEVHCISKCCPDLVIGDLRPTLSISCEYLEKPFIAILNGYWTSYYMAKHSIPDSFMVSSFLSRSFSPIIFPLFKFAILRLGVIPFNKKRCQMGLGKRKDLFDVMSSNFLNLIVDLPLFTPQNKLPEHYKFIGPVIWEPVMKNPTWLSKVKKDRPVIYFTIGTTGFKKILELAIRLYSKKDYQVIITTGDSKMRLKNDSEHIYIEEFAPGLKIMEISDVVVCHGGNGTIYQAFSTETPIIGIPTMHDQWFNMERVQELGAGLLISHQQLKIDDIENAVDQILMNPKFKRNVSRFKREILKFNAPDAAVGHITSKW